MQQPTPPIPVWQDVKATYRGALSAPSHFFRALAVPLLLAVGIAMADMLLSADQDSGFSASAVFLQLLPYAVLGLAWGSFELLGEAPPVLPDNTELRRFFVFAGYLLLFALVLFIPVVVTVLVLAGPTADDVLLGVTAVLVGLIVCWHLARLSLVLPATAIDRGLGLGSAWRLSRGNSARLFAALLLVSMPVVMIFGLFLAVLTYLLATNTLPAEASLDQPGLLLVEFVIAVLANGIQLAGFALLMGLLTRAFQHLNGWQTNRQEILERFE